mgnify:CR=1 FL=1
MFLDKAKNQHYISVSEQKLNSIDGSIQERDKIKVYSFDLVDREEHKISLSALCEKKAVKNLSYFDLYTFELLDGGQRHCFERLFRRLEDVVGICTNKILDGSEFTVDDFLNVFKAKILNMIRNPFCIEFTLNNFKQLSGSYPVNQELKAYYDKIDMHTIPVETLIEFNVSEEKYKQWLKIIFLMITPLHDQKYILDNIAENFLNLEKYYHIINICKFTNEVCLLSDRGYVNLSSLFNQSNGLCFGFNLRRDAFIYLTFLPNDLEMITKQLSIPFNKSMIDEFKAIGIKTIQSSLSIQCHVNNKELLKSYNRHAIYQCAKNVYAAKDSVLI